MSQTSGPPKPKFLGSKAPQAQGIKARSSTVTNAFAHSVLPVVETTLDEFYEAMRVLGQDPDNLRCVYCGAPTHGWDHLRPTIFNKRPTGYITEVANHVPACGKCNSSKGGRDWRKWMRGKAKGSPTSRGIPDVEDRVKRLEAFERRRPPTVIDFNAILGKEEWDAYWRSRDAILKEMLRCQQAADTIRKKLEAALQNASEPPRP